MVAPVIRNLKLKLNIKATKVTIKRNIPRNPKNFEMLYENLATLIHDLRLPLLAIYFKETHFYQKISANYFF